MDGSWRSKNDGYRSAKLRDATLDVRNSEGTAPARGVEAALVDKSKLTSIRDPKILGRMGMEISKDGKLVTKVDTMTYGTCRRARLMPYPSHWASVGMGAFEFLMALQFIGGLAVAYYQIDSADILNVGVVNMRTLLATIASVSTVWVCVLAAGAFTNGKNEKMAFEAIQADRDLGSLYNQVQCNCPQIRWGFLHQALFAAGHWVNFAYLHAEINDSNLGGSTFPTFSEGLARLYRVRVWITAIMCTMQLSLFLLDYFELSHLMMYSGPATEISSDGSNALQLCEPLDGGNKYNYDGNLKLVVDFYGLARIGFIVFNMYVVYELLKQLTYYRFLPIQWSPETWRSVVLAEWIIHLIIFGLAAGAAIAMNGIKCARAQAVKVAALHAAFFVAWIVLWAVGYNDFITVTGRTHLATQADRERFENMLWFSLLISSEAIYLTAAPWLRCQLNNGAFETLLEYMPDFL